MMYSVLRVSGNVAQLFTAPADYSTLPMEIRLRKPDDRVLTIDLSHATDWDAHLSEIEEKLNILELKVPAIMTGEYELLLDTALDTPEDKHDQIPGCWASFYKFGLNFLAMLVRRKIDLEVSIYLPMKPGEDE